MTAEMMFLSRDGRSVRGALATPAGLGPHPAVVVVQEWWGLNDDMKAVADRLAGEGFLAAAVDLYGGRVATDRETAKQLVTELKVPDAVEIVAGAAAALTARAAGGNGAVGVTGFCVGGAVALAAACHVPAIGAAVPFYGMPRPEHVDWKRARCPFQLHYGKKDESIPVAKVEAMVKDMKAAGRDATLHLYDAGHAFMRRSDPAVYDERSAEVAWHRMVAFFKERLVGKAR